MRLHCQLVLASLRLELGEMQEALCESVFGVRIVPGTSGHVNRTGRESNVALWPPQVPPLLEEVFLFRGCFRIASPAAGLPVVAGCRTLHDKAGFATASAMASTTEKKGNFAGVNEV